MTKEEYNPKTCGNSIDMCGVYVCRLEVVPCPIQRGQTCGKMHFENFINEVKQIMKDIEVSE